MENEEIKVDEEQIVEPEQTIQIIAPEQTPVEPTEEEIIEKRKKELQYKVALGTATTTEKSDLKLLIA